MIKEVEVKKDEIEGGSIRTVRYNSQTSTLKLPNLNLLIHYIHYSVFI